MSAIASRDDTPPEKRTLYWHFNRLLERYMPEQLYQRSLIIVIAPVVLLQGLMAWVFLDRHYETVTKSLSQSFVRDVALVVKTWEKSPHTEADLAKVLAMANDDLALGEASCTAAGYQQAVAVIRAPEIDALSGL
jgi:two-component system osmolarity sensor histidine kinase EnvZ